MTLRWAFLTLILLAVTACAKPPHHELETAERMIGKARTLSAAHYAPTEFKAAGDAFADGQNLMRREKYGKAKDALNFALKHARRAIVVTEEALAKEAALAEREAAAEKARQAAELERIKAEAKSRHAAIEAAKAKERQAAAKPADPQPEPAPPGPATTYQVGEGETLWTIAAQSTVYDDGHLWPLLYQANRDQIKDPRQIFPGQVLMIRRDLTDKDIEEARQKARDSDVFPIPAS